MKIIFYIILCVFSFNATAESFTERVSAKYNAEVDKVKTETSNKISKEQKSLEDQCYNYNGSNKAIQWFLLIMAIMLIVIYIQNKKIGRLSHQDAHH